MKRNSSLICRIGFFLLLGAMVVLGQASLEKRTSLDINAVSPADVFGSLAQTLGCGLEIDPGVTTPVTMRLSNITVRTALNVLCESIGCAWRLAGNTLHVEAKPALRPAYVRVDPSRGIFDKQTPPDFKFKDMPLKSVLEALGKVGGIEISVEEPEASRPVTLDLSSRTILSALKEISRSAELKSGVVLAGFSDKQGRGLKIKFVNRPAPKAAKKSVSEFKDR